MVDATAANVKNSKKSQANSVATAEYREEPGSVPPQRQRNPSVPFFKPYQGKGAAAIFDVNMNSGDFFLMMMPEQAGEEKKFDASAKNLFKMGLPDIGEMLAVLRGIKPGAGTMKDGKWAGLFHQNDSGNSSVYFERNENGYRLSLGVKRGQDQPVRYSLNLTIGEGVILEEFFVNFLGAQFSR